MSAKTRTRKKRKVAPVDFSRFTNKLAREYLYSQKLAMSFWQETGKEPRTASRSEIINFLNQIA